MRKHTVKYKRVFFSASLFYKSQMNYRFFKRYRKKQRRERESTTKTIFLCSLLPLSVILSTIHLPCIVQRTNRAEIDLSDWLESAVFWVRVFGGHGRQLRLRHLLREAEWLPDPPRLSDEGQRQATSLHCRWVGISRLWVGKVRWGPDCKARWRRSLGGVLTSPTGRCAGFTNCKICRHHWLESDIIYWFSERCYFCVCFY